MENYTNRHSIHRNPSQPVLAFNRQFEQNVQAAYVTKHLLETKVELPSYIRTPSGILSYPVLFTPKAPAPDAEPRFSLVLVFDEAAQNTPEYAQLKQAVMACGTAEFGSNLPGNMRWPFRDCSEKSDKEPFASIEGGKFISAWSKTRPGIVDGSPERNEIAISEDVWAGQLARITCRPFAYRVSGNNGVSLALQNVQITKSAGQTRLDGRRAPAADFDAVDGYMANESGVAGDDADNLPF